MNDRFGNQRNRGEFEQHRSDEPRRSGGDPSQFGRGRDEERARAHRQGGDPDWSASRGGQHERAEPRYSSDWDETYGSEWERGRGDSGSRMHEGQGGQLPHVERSRPGWYSRGSAGMYGGGSGGGYLGGRGGSGYGGATGTDYGGGSYGGYAGDQARFGGDQGGYSGSQGGSYHGAGGSWQELSSRNRSEGNWQGGSGREQGRAAYGNSQGMRSSHGNANTTARGGFAGRGPKGYTRTDDRIREDVCERLSMDDDVDATDIEVRVENGEVTLVGTVQTRSMKHHAEDLAEDVSGVKDVHNQLRVMKGMINELKDKVTGKESDAHYANGGTRTTPASATPARAGTNGTL